MTRRILVIDDEADLREVTQTSLELVGGHDVLTAGSGRDGLELAIREQPDAILLDVMMPGLDGPGTVELLRADDRTRHIPIVLLTAKAQTAERQRLAQLDVQGVMAKPFDPISLPEQLAVTLGW